MKLLIHIFSIFLFSIAISLNTNAQTIALSSPTSNTTYKDNLSVVISISGETSGTISNVKLIFEYTDGNYKANIGKKDSVTLVSALLTQTFSFNPSTITSSTLFKNNTGDLVDGTYTIYANYTRSTGAIVKSTNRTNVVIDTKALPPVIISPIANSTVKSTFYYRDSIPEGYASGSRQLSLQSAVSGKKTTITFVNGYRLMFLNINSSSIKSNLAIQATTDSTIDDGPCLFTLSYKDNYGHTTTTSHFVTIDSKTLPPIIAKPLNNVRQNGQLDLLVNFPEQMTSGSAKLLFKKSGGRIDSLVLANPSVGANNYAINLKNLTSSNISGSSTTSLSDGSYDIILTYQDAVGNVAASDTISNFILDHSTLAPTIINPSESQVLRSGDVIHFDFTLPEQAKEGSVIVNLSDGSSIIPITLNTNSSGSYSVRIDPLDVNGSLQVQSSSRKWLDNGNYTIQISYQDVTGNPVALSESKTILIDRETLPMSNVSVSDSTSAGGFLDIAYTLPENALGNSVKLLLSGCEEVSMNLGSVGKGAHSFRINGNNLLKTNRITKSTQPTIPNGDYAVFISYQDTLGNVRTESIRPKLHVRGVTPPPVLRTKNYNPICNDTLALLNQAITSDTTGLTVRYYSDSTMVNEIQNIVNRAGKYYVKVTNVHDLDITDQITVQEFTICPEGLNKLGTKTRNRHKYVDKNGKIGNFRTVDKNGVIISIPH